MAKKRQKKYTKKCTVSMTASMKKRLASIKASSGTTYTALIREAIAEVYGAE